MKPKQYLPLIIIIALSIFLISCTKPRSSSAPSATTDTSPSIQVENVTPPIPTIQAVEIAPPVLVACQRNSECQDSKLCIDGLCRHLSDVNNVTNCAKLCRLTKTTFHTSDDETYSLTPGQGTYTAAGALEWKLNTFGGYCQGVKPRVPLLLLKKNAGKILEETLITLIQGETSSIITHPTVKRVKFTVSLASYEEKCE